MERRAFLRLFASAAAAFAVDAPTLEQVLAQPEAREYTEEEVQAAFAQLADSFFMESPIVQYLKRKRAAGGDYKFVWMEQERV